MIWARKKENAYDSALSLPDIVLRGKRVYLRPPQLSDWPAWKAVRQSNRQWLQPFEPRWPKGCLEEDFFIRRLSRQSHEWQHDRARSFLIFNVEDTLIGGVNINNICRGAAQHASLGYWIDKQHQGRGLMGEALRATLQFCFGRLELHRVNAACLEHNRRSIRLLLRTGFKEEGFAEKYLCINGEWQDHILFGLTQEQWRQNSFAKVLAAKEF